MFIRNSSEKKPRLPSSPVASWLAGGGLMGDLVRQTDWSQTSLGPLDQWPQSLRVAVGICLNSRFPMFVWWGPDLINIYNDAYMPILGKRHPEALGRPAQPTWREIWDVVGPQADAVMTRGEATWNERVLLVMERKGYTEETWFTWSYSPITDETGAVVGLFCACTEETARVVSERERDRLATQRRLALDAAKLGWWHLDPATNAVTVDDRFREIFALFGESISNDVTLGRVHPDDRERVWESARAAMDPGQAAPFASEYRIVLDDGSIRWIMAHGVASFEGEGAARMAISFVGTVADITGSRLAEERDRRAAAEAIAAAEVNAKFRTFFEQGPYFAAVMAVDGTVIETNKLSLDATGFSREQVIGRKFWDCPWWDDEPDLKRRMRAASEFAAAGNVFREETPYYIADGTRRELDLTLAPVLDDHGRVLFVAPTGIDITERKHAESALRASEQRFRFLSELSESTRDLMDPEAILATIAERLGRHLRTSRCAYADVENDSEHFTIRHDYTDGCSSTVGQYRLSAFGPRAAANQRAGVTLVVHDVDAEMEPDEGAATFKAIGIKALICRPLVRRGQLVAMMAVHQTTPRRWTPEEVALVEEVVERSWAYLERVRTQRALNEARERLEFSVNAAELGTFYCPMPLGKVVWNTTCKEHFFLAPDAEISIDLFYTLIHEEDRQRTREAVEQAVFRNQPYDIQYRTMSADGRFRWIRAKGRAYYDAAGNPTRFDGITIDITEAKRAEAELRDSEQRFRQMADTAPATLWITEPDGWCSFLSRGWYEFTGQDESTALGFGWVSAAHPDDRPLARAAFVAANRDRAPYEVDFRVRRVDGEYRWVVDAGRPRFAPDGEFLGMIGTVIDITERKRAEEERRTLLEAERSARLEAERAGRMKDEFLATLSHELRTPLNAILGWSQMLNRGRFDDLSAIREGIDTIARNARAQAQLVEDLLDMSRIISGKVRLDIQKVDPRDIVKGAVQAVSHAAEAKGIELRTEVDASGVISGDPDRLQQVLWNLLSNAIKFTDRGGRVTISVRRANSQLAVAVSDNGKGVKLEFLPYVFDRFRQADSSTTRQYGGLGLGLAIVKHLVELHGGTVHAMSAGDGLGSTFTVTLPIAAAFEADPPPAVGKGSLSQQPIRTDGPPMLNGLRILVVDDDPDARTLLTRVLADRGARVTTAGSAFEALDLVQQSPFDAIVSDIGMPQQDGYEFMRNARASRQAAHTPAVALTAFARAEDRQRALEAGYQVHVTKPVEPAELVAVVANLARIRLPDDQ